MTTPLFFLSHRSILSLADLAKDAYLHPVHRLPGYTFLSDEDTDAQGYISNETLQIQGVRQECIVISFRGTESIKDVITDLSATRVPLTGKPVGFFQSLLPNRGVPLVHWGFLQQYQSILPEIRQYLNTYPDIKHVVCTGHSLGGALATLAVVDLASRACGENRVFSCVTFGSPRVGNKKFAELFDRVTENRSIRFVNNDDPIPLLPSSLRFHHVSGVAELQTDYGPNFIRTYLNTSTNRWKRVGRVIANTITTTVSCSSGSASDHSSSNYYDELAEILV